MIRICIEIYQGRSGGPSVDQQQGHCPGGTGSLATEVGLCSRDPFTQISGIANTVKYVAVAFGLEEIWGVEPDVIRRGWRTKLRSSPRRRHSGPNPISCPADSSSASPRTILIMEQDINQVIDEPTSQLNPQSTDDVFEVIKLMKDWSRTIVLIEHKMEPDCPLLRPTSLCWIRGGWSGDLPGR